MRDHATFEDLCKLAEQRALHVELWSNHRTKAAREPASPPPAVNEIRITDAERGVLYRAPATLANIDRAAGLALRQVA